MHTYGSPQCPAMARAGSAVLSHRIDLNSLSSEVKKHNRSDMYKANDSPCLNISPLRNYTNFMNSGLPQRLMFYQDGMWIDFPQDVVEVARRVFKMKKVAIEIDTNGYNFVLDILYMIQVDLNNGLHSSIAWIDDAGCCFFPELFHDDKVMYDCGLPTLDKDTEELFSKSDRSHTINMHLEIDLNGINGRKLEEDVEETDNHIKRTKVDHMPFTNHCGIQVGDNFNERSDAKAENYVEIQSAHEHLVTKSGHMLDSVDVGTLRKIFYAGTSSLRSADILEIKQCSGGATQARLELFQKQIQITERLRGTANVRYAWLACSKDVTYGITSFRLGPCGYKSMSIYGIGVHLASANNAHISASYCDDDKNGVRYMIFCRVILGSVELVHPESRQHWPSSKNYDSGVDDLRDPRVYIVWDMNMKTHIYPEYVVNFKVPTKAEGTSGSTVSQSLSCQMPKGSSSGLGEGELMGIGKGKGGITCNQKGTPPPKSLWMPFPVLLEAISTKVAQNKMELVYIHYDLFKSKKISRDNFVRELRLAIGDSLLKHTIISLQGKYTFHHVCNRKAPKQDQES